MNKLLKLLHLVGVAGFLGAVVVAMLLSLLGPQTSAEAQAFTRAAIVLVSSYIALPSLLLVLASGMMLVIKQPLYFPAHWVWAKAAIGVLILPLALMLWAPAIERAAAFARSGAFGTPVLGGQEAAVRIERIGGGALILFSLTAMALATWRPRFIIRGAGEKRDARAAAQRPE